MSENRKYKKLRPISERLAEIVVYSRKDGYSFPRLEKLKELRRLEKCTSSS